MRYITIILRIFLGTTFLFSAYTKAVAPGFFEITLMDQGLAGSRDFAAQMTRFFIGLEVALGTLIIFPFFTKKLMTFTLFLLGGFTIQLIYLFAIGNTENCGCFGEMISMTPKESIIKNILLISIALFIFLKSNDIKTPLIAPIIFSLLTISSIWIILPIPNNKNFPFKEFTQFEPSGRIDLAKKNAFVAIFNLDCEHCQEVAKELAELKRTSQNIPEVYVLFYQEGNSSVEKFENITGSKYPYTFIDVNTFFDLIGNSPPRIYYIKDGSVIEVWDENHLESIKKRFAINQEAIKEL